MKITEKEFRKLYNECFIYELDCGINAPYRLIYANEEMAVKQAKEKGFIKKDNLQPS